MTKELLEGLFFFVVLIGLSIPLGLYMYRILIGERVFLTRVLSPMEKGIYRLLSIRDEDSMSPKRYLLSALFLSACGFILLFLLLVFQNYLPGNPTHMGGVSPALAFNIAASFVSNTNWQSYSGESTLSYFSQSIGLTVQNFVSAAMGIAILFVLIRGFIQKEKTNVGNFWKDMIRISLYVLLPLSFLLALLLVSQGVVQSLLPGISFTSLENKVSDLIPLGPAASQVAIKQLGTNGGGFFGANSAFPLENPTSFSNFLELLSILLIPAALLVTFGKAVRDKKQTLVLYITMLVFLVGSFLAVTYCESNLAPSYVGVVQSGNMEGKEVINGIASSSLWSVATTAASNGSVNAMLDSFTPLSGAVLLFLMQIGEVIFGGVGSGLYGMLAFVILTVFIAGLMVGRTPEYLGKKIGAYDMKMVCTIVLVPPIVTLLGLATAVSLPAASSWLTNPGAHGFTEILYAFTSMGANNGSAFGGFAANTTFSNLLGGVIMLVARFVPMAAVVLLGGSLSKKKVVAASEGTLATGNLLFAGLLIAIILIIGALTFLPALSLGPIADYFTAS